MRKKILSSLFAIGMIATAFVMSCSKKDDSVAVTSVQLSDNEMVIMGGGTATLTATILPENADNKAVTWTSSAPEIVSVNENGVVKALAEEGSATIIVTTQDGGKTAVCKVIVKPRVHVSEIKQKYTEFTLMKGQTTTLTVFITPEDATDKSVKWESSDAKTVSVNENGLITAIEEGTATITVTTKDGGKTATCEVKVAPLANIAPGVTNYITMVTEMNVDERIGLAIDVANESDKEGVWIDLNNNGKKDTDEDSVNFGENLNNYALQSQTITLYGKITYLKCFDQILTTLNVTQAPQLVYLDCGENKLGQLDVSQNTQLGVLYCYSNYIEELDISKNTQLTEFYCDDNILKQLDVSKNTQLTELYCGGNALKQLDVSKNTQLTQLDCSINELKQLDVSKNTQLTQLDCSRNKLKQLDISKNTLLTELNCRKNELTQEAMAELLSGLPAVSGTDKGKAYIVGDASDKNYRDITDKQKRDAKVKNWILYVNSKPINE